MIISGEQARVAGTLPIRPSRRWYWVAGGILAGAVLCIALGVAGFFSLNRQIEDFQRISVPGQAEVSFAQPGRYVLYVEGPGQCCSFSSGSVDSAPVPNGSMDVTLQPVNGGPPVAISGWQGATQSYGVAGHQGQAAAYFTIEHPGRYVLVASNVTPSSIADVAVGRGISRGIIPLVLILAAIFALIPAGLSTGGVTAFRRRRARRVLLPAPQVMAPMADQWPTMSAPGPYQTGGYQTGPYPSSGYPGAHLTYLQGGPVGFGEAIKQAFRNGFCYRGRASRSAYWWFILFQVIAFVGISIVISLIANVSVAAFLAGLAILAILVIYLELAGHALLVRRLHDTDRSGWSVFNPIAPIFLLLEGAPGPNRYEPMPGDEAPASGPHR